MSEPRGALEREARVGLELAGPMSFAEAFYLARRAEGLGCMEATLATRTRDRWPPQSGAHPRARLAVGEILDAIRAGA